MLNDNKKIGLGLLCLSFVFFFLGIMLFLNNSLLAMGDVLFLMGLVFFIGVERTIKLFTKPGRKVGTAIFFLGFLVIFLKYSSLLGICLQLFGFINLFGNFIPQAIAMLKQVPYLKEFLKLPGIWQIVNKLQDIEGKRIPV